MGALALLSVACIEMKQNFHVVRKMNRNLFLGTDFLKQHWIQIYINSGCNSTGIGDKNYVNLVENIYIASVLE